MVNGQSASLVNGQLSTLACNSTAGACFQACARHPTGLKFTCEAKLTIHHSLLSKVNPLCLSIVNFKLSLKIHLRSKIGPQREIHHSLWSMVNPLCLSMVNSYYRSVIHRWRKLPSLCPLSNRPEIHLRSKIDPQREIYHSL